MKKLVTLVMAMALVLALAVTASAAITEYVDVDFTATGDAYDSQGNATLIHTNSGKSEIKLVTVEHAGDDYDVPAFVISGGAQTNYNFIAVMMDDLTDYNDWKALFEAGMTVEAFFQASDPSVNQVIVGNPNGAGWGIFMNPAGSSWGDWAGAPRWLVNTGTSSSKAYLEVGKAYEADATTPKVYKVTDELTHVVGVYAYDSATNTTTATMYVNGAKVLALTDSTRGAMFNWEPMHFSAFGIGNAVFSSANQSLIRGAKTNCTNVVITDVKLYSGAASDTEVAKMYTDAVANLVPDAAINAEDEVVTKGTTYDLAENVGATTKTITTSVVDSTATYTLDNNKLTLTSAGTVTVKYVVGNAEKVVTYTVIGDVSVDVYMDMELKADGTVTDAEGNATLTHVTNSGKSEITYADVTHAGKTYRVPAFVVDGVTTNATPVEYIFGKYDITRDEYMDLFGKGLTVEVFFQDTNPNNQDGTYEQTIMGNTNGSAWGLIITTKTLADPYSYNGKAGAIRGIISTQSATVSKAYQATYSHGEVHKELTHVVMTYEYDQTIDKTIGIMYINGVQSIKTFRQGSMVVLASPATSYKFFGIGVNYNSNGTGTTEGPANNTQVLDMVMVDAKMYSGTATAADVAAMYVAAVNELEEKNLMPYFDLELDANGNYSDAESNVTLTYVNSGKSEIKEVTVKHGINTYTVPAFVISGAKASEAANGASSDYIYGTLNNVATYSDYVELFGKGFIAEMFVKNDDTTLRNTVPFGNGNGAGWAFYTNKAHGTWNGGVRFGAQAGIKTNKNWLWVYKGYEDDGVTEKNFSICNELTHVIGVFAYDEVTKDATTTMYVNGVKLSSTTANYGASVYNIEAGSWKYFGIGANYVTNGSGVPRADYQCGDLTVVDANIYMGKLTDDGAKYLYEQAVARLGTPNPKSDYIVVAGNDRAVEAGVPVDVTADFDVEVAPSGNVFTSTEPTIKYEVVDANVSYTFDNNELTINAPGDVTVRAYIEESLDYYAAEAFITYTGMAAGLYNVDEYFDLELKIDGSANDEQGNYDLKVVTSGKSSIKITEVTHKGKKYYVPAFVIDGATHTEAANAGSSDYIYGTIVNVDTYEDYVELFDEGFVFEIFLQNTDKTAGYHNSVVYGNGNGAGWGFYINKGSSSLGDWAGALRFGVQTGTASSHAWTWAQKSYEADGVTPKPYKITEELTHVVGVMDYDKTTHDVVAKMYINGVKVIESAATNKAAGMYNIQAGSWKYFGIGANYVTNTSGTPRADFQCGDLIVVDAKMYQGVPTDFEVKVMYDNAVAALGGTGSSGSDTGVKDETIKAPVVTVEGDGNIVMSPERANEGAVVTIYPENKEEITSVSVVDENGKVIEVKVVDGKFTFTLPAEQIFVNVVLACDGGFDCETATYEDVKADTEYHNAIDYVVGKGWMVGYGNGKFGPKDTLSRAMLAQILYNAAGKPEVAEAASYTDVDADAWYADAIAWAEDTGVVAGYGNGKFGPDDEISIEQVIIMLYNYAGKPSVAYEIVADDAASISDYAVNAWRWALDKGIVDTAQGKLNPQAKATRAYTAQLLMLGLGK